MSAPGIYERELARVRAQFRKKSGGGLKSSGSAKASTPGKGIGPSINVSDLPDILMPRILEESTRFLISFSQALANQIKYRVSVLGIGEDGAPTHKANNTGGMWKGLEVRGAVGRCTLQFMKGSYPSQKGKKAQGMEGLSRRQKSAMRKKLNLKKVRNRQKAETVQEVIDTDLLAPTLQEIDQTLQWFKKAFDESLLKD